MLNINKDVTKYLVRPLVGVDVGDQFFAIKFEDRLGFFLVNLESPLDHLLVDVRRS
jgi:hypothetical protein